MVALVEVFVHQLPVGGDLVGAGSPEAQPLGLVVGDQPLEVAQPVGERRSFACGVDENPAAPLFDPRRHQAVVIRIAAGQLARARRNFQAAVELVGPAVVGAAQRAGVGAGARLEQLVAAVAADVEEAAQGAVIAAHEQDAVVADARGAVVARPGQIVGASQADPGRFVEAALLPGENVWRDVGLAGQVAAVAEGRQHALKGSAVERRRRGKLGIHFPKNQLLVAGRSRFKVSATPSGLKPKGPGELLKAMRPSRSIT